MLTILTDAESLWVRGKARSCSRRVGSEDQGNWTRASSFSGHGADRGPGSNLDCSSGVLCQLCVLSESFGSAWQSLQGEFEPVRRVGLC